MTVIRRHLVSVVAVVLAVATGIALGAGPLSRETLVPTRTVITPQPEQAHDTTDELAEAVAPRLTPGRLTGRNVALLSTPGVDQEVLDRLQQAVEEAGGRVPARWRVGPSLVAAGETALVDTLGEQLLEQLGDDVVDPEAPAYERMGQLLGAAVASPDRAQPAGEAATTVRQSIDAASLLTTEAEEPVLAPLVLVVLGDDVEDPIVEGLMTGLATRASRVVVAAARRDGDLAALEELDAVTTVDGVGDATGRLATVLALATPAGEPPGSYGASGSDGVLPLR